MAPSTFAVQLAVSAVGLALSVGMLLAGRDPAVYLPVVTSVVAYWLPAPRRPDAPPPGPPTAASSVRSVGHAVPDFEEVTQPPKSPEKKMDTES